MQVPPFRQLEGVQSSSLTSQLVPEKPERQLQV
jgi:hypothetical protein